MMKAGLQYWLDIILLIEPCAWGEIPGTDGAEEVNGAGAGSAHGQLAIVAVAGEEGGALQPLLVRVVDEQVLLLLDAVDQRVGHVMADRWAAVAVAQVAGLLDEGFADVVGTVDDDSALVGQVVDAVLETLQAQRVAVTPVVGVHGAKEPQARLVALRDIREGGGHGVTGAAAVGDQLLEEQLVAGQVEYPQARFAGGQGVVDHR